MANRDLASAWKAAESAAPDGWELCGIARGPRIADPAIEDHRWVAWARGPADEPPVEGEGDSPVTALSSLAKQLKDAKA